MGSDAIKIFIDGRIVVGYEDATAQQSVAEEGVLTPEISLFPEVCGEESPPDVTSCLTVMCVPRTTLFLPGPLRREPSAAARPAPAAFGGDIAKAFGALAAKPVEGWGRWEELRILISSAQSADLAAAVRDIRDPLDQARFLILLQAFSPDKLGDVMKRVDATIALELITQHLIVIDRDGQTISLGLGGGGTGSDGLPSEQPDEVIAWACLNTLLEAKGLCGIGRQGSGLVLITDDKHDATVPSHQRIYHATSDGRPVSARLEYIDGVLSHQIVIHISGDVGEDEAGMVFAETAGEIDSSASAQPPEAPPPSAESSEEPNAEKSVRSLFDAGIKDFILSSIDGAMDLRDAAEPLDDVPPDDDDDKGVDEDMEILEGLYYEEGVAVEVEEFEEGVFEGDETEIEE